MVHSARFLFLGVTFQSRVATVASRSGSGWPELVGSEKECENESEKERENRKEGRDIGEIGQREEREKRDEKSTLQTPTLICSDF